MYGMAMSRLSSAAAYDQTVAHDWQPGYLVVETCLHPARPRGVCVDRATPAVERIGIKMLLVRRVGQVVNFTGENCVTVQK